MKKTNYFKKPQKPPKQTEFRCGICQSRHDCPAYCTGVIYPCPHFNENRGCKYCLNARIDDELTDNNDLSYHGCGSAITDYRCMIKSGGGRPTSIIFEEHTAERWNTIANYHPKYCPECGRNLTNDYPERRKQNESVGSI